MFDLQDLAQALDLEPRSSLSAMLLKGTGKASNRVWFSPVAITQDTAVATGILANEAFSPCREIAQAYGLASSGKGFHLTTSELGEGLDYSKLFLTQYAASSDLGIGISSAVASVPLFWSPERVTVLSRLIMGASLQAASTDWAATRSRSWLGLQQNTTDSATGQSAVSARGRLRAVCSDSAFGSSEALSRLQAVADARTKSRVYGLSVARQVWAADVKERAVTLSGLDSLGATAVIPMRWLLDQQRRDA